MAIESIAEVDPTGAPSHRVNELRELMRLLVKALKAERLYQSNNAIAQRLETDLYSRLFDQLDEQGRFEIGVEEFKITFGDDVIYESTDRNDSLAFLLFRDGIRRLSFSPGLEDTELKGFLRCLNRVRVHTSEQDDLLTLFWEEDFKSITFEAIEELDAESMGPRLEEQLESGALGTGHGVGGGADRVSLQDLEQPNAHLPAEACRLTEEELDALKNELQVQEADAFCVAVVEVAIELVLLETGEQERQQVAHGLLAVLDRLTEEGQLDEVSRAVEHLGGISEMLFSDCEPVRQLRATIVAALCESERLGNFLEQVESSRCLKPIKLTEHLARLGPQAAPSLIPWMARMRNSVFRRAVADAVITAKEVVVDDLEEQLTVNGNLADATYVRELLHVVSHLDADKALPLLERVLDRPEASYRREALSALGRLDGERAARMCLRHLDDPDAEVRALALDTLVLRGAPQLAKTILDETLADPNFDHRSLAEKRRRFAAVAKLGGQQSLDWFTELIRPEERRWFASRREREILSSATHGIRLVGTPSAMALLQHMASNGDRFVRGAANRELSERRS